MKRTCRGCLAREGSWASRWWCQLGHSVRTVFDKFNYSHGVPGEECPKPMTRGAYHKAYAMRQSASGKGGA